MAESQDMVVLALYGLMAVLLVAAVAALRRRIKGELACAALASFLAAVVVHLLIIAYQGRATGFVLASFVVSWIFGCTVAVITIWIFRSRESSR